MEPIKICKTVDAPKSHLKILYEGIPNTDEFSIKQIEELFNDFLYHHRHDQMLENVIVMRTILKDFQECSLKISYEDKKGLEFALFTQSKLSFYEKRSVGNYQINYEPTSGIKLDYYNNHNLNDFSQLENVSQEMNDLVKHIYFLENAQGIYLSEDAKVLIEIYKLFYNENPNFSHEDIHIKVQSMMSILALYGVTLGDNYGFHLLGKDKMPMSLNLEQLIQKLYPLGEVVHLKDRLNLSNETIKIIKIVGESVRECISNSSDSEKALLFISKASHVKRYHLPISQDISEKENASSFKLVKSIQRRLENEI